MKHLFFNLILPAVILAGSFAAHAQQSSLSGTVRDINGDYVAGATVTVSNKDTNSRLTVNSNADGIFIFPSLTPGNYSLTATSDGLETIQFDNIVIETGSNVTRNFALAARNLNETIVVEDTGITINSTDASVGSVINRRFVENIPLNGRSFQSLMTVVPGVTAVASAGTGSSGGISVNGQRTEANYFTVDGVSANTGLPPTGTPGFGAGFSGSTPGETALGTTHSLVSLDSLQEFKAATSTYSAEHGRTAGGQFIFTTRSGTNDLHGSLYAYVRNDVFDANNFFTNARNTPKPATRQYNFGGTFGGPLPFFNMGGNEHGLFRSGKDRTFFFVSYEGLRLRTPQAGVDTYVPSQALRNNAADVWKPFMNAFPVPTGPDRPDGLAIHTASYSNPSEIDNFAIRIDHRFSNNFNIFGRYSDTPSERTNRLLTNLAQTQSIDFRSRSFTFGAGMIFGNLVNDLRINFAGSNSESVYNTDSFGGASPLNIGDIPTVNTDPNNRVNIAFNFGGRPTFTLLNQVAEQEQFNLVNNVSIPFGRHNLKFGVDYRRTASELVLPPRFMPINVASHTQFLTNSMANFNLVTYWIDKLRPVYQNFSLFVQDEWRATRRLSVSMGLRYEVNPAPEDKVQNPYNIDQIDDLSTTRLVTDSSRPLWKTTWNNFAPRLGLAYNLNEKHGWETVIRTGIGIFYDLGNTQASDGYGRAGFRRTSTFHGSPFPLTDAQVSSILPPSLATPYTETVLTDDPNLKLPYTIQWNGAVEQGLGGSQTITVSYIGASGQRLLIDRSFTPRALGNTNFAANAAIVLTQNLGRSEYHALQAQFQRRLSRGLQANASYTWSHSIDNATSNFTVRMLTRGPSDFDIKHNFQAALSYDIPGNYDNALASVILKHWAIDARISARTALPINIIGESGVDPAIPYLSLDFLPNVTGQPYYIEDSSAPGGRRINRDAFAVARNPDNSLTQGDLGRNALRGFGSFQSDIALRRNFPIGERFNLQFRAESFNIFNRANFGAIENRLSVAEFGRALNTQNEQLGGLNSLYQVGGPRSFQFALKLLF